MADTNEQAKAYAAALVTELGYAKHHLAAHDADQEANPRDREALESRVNEITAELQRVSGKAKSPAKRAEARPASRHESR